MLNTFEKNISYSLNLLSENNLDIFQNALLFDNNKLITEKDKKSKVHSQLKMNKVIIIQI